MGHDSLAGQVVVVLGGSSGIGLETARQAGAAGAELVLTGRNRERLDAAAADVGAKTVATLNLGDPTAVEQFFAELPPQIDHVLVSGGGPFYA
ncbi:MAG TPA: SDR family NAD(P)-dependent oxidoreductase, partial [Gaiellales bacterium]|nr:SDR family NAD(P)-dependent oxidoreductase [Gaiellales bacterium]